MTSNINFGLFFVELMKSFFNAVSDEQLRVCVIELQELNEIGVLRSGEVRNLSRQLCEGTGIAYGDALHIVQEQALKLAAFKWAGI
jgi:hypothetical protein